MSYRIEFVDDLMTICGANGEGFDAFEIDPASPWDAVETLAEWGREYDLDPCQALRELRKHFARAGKPKRADDGASRWVVPAA